MDRHGTSELKSLLTEESGQAATEYALAVLWTVILIWTTALAVESALLDYYLNVTSLICLPIP